MNAIATENIATIHHLGSTYYQAPGSQEDNKCNHHVIKMLTFYSFKLLIYYAKLKYHYKLN